MTSFISWWSGFRYNYAWSDWVGYIDGWIPRFSFFFPIIGYMILFNDQISEMIQFQRITHQITYDWGLSATTRLRFVYYGLFFLGVSNFIYRIKKPYAFRFGRDFVEYTRTALENFTYGDFVQIHGTIRHKGHLTLDGKYYDSEWDGFKNTARNAGEGTDNVERTGSWEDAKRSVAYLLSPLVYGGVCFAGGTQYRLVCKSYNFHIHSMKSLQSKHNNGFQATSALTRHRAIWRGYKSDIKPAPGSPGWFLLTPIGMYS